MLYKELVENDRNDKLTREIDSTNTIKGQFGKSIWRDALTPCRNIKRFRKMQQYQKILTRCQLVYAETFKDCIITHLSAKNSIITHMTVHFLVTF